MHHKYITNPCKNDQGESFNYSGNNAVPRCPPSPSLSCGRLVKLLGPTWHGHLESTHMSSEVHRLCFAMNAKKDRYHLQAL